MPVSREKNHYQSVEKARSCKNVLSHERIFREINLHYDLLDICENVNVTEFFSKKQFPHQKEYVVKSCNSLVISLVKTLHAFTKFLPKMCETKSQQVPYCAHTGN